jgi:hypothetical protein
MVAARRCGASRLSALSSTTGAVAERLDLLGPTQPHPLLAMRTTRSRKLAGVERYEHRVEGWRGGLAGTPVGRGNGALADRLGVAGGHAQAVAG